MKPILVLTDFSGNAAYAGETAAWLAEKMKRPIWLWNCTNKPPVVAGYGGGLLLAEALTEPPEIPKQLLEKATELQDFLSVTGEGYRPELFIHHREGNFHEELSAELHRQSFELIIMGASSVSDVGHVFIGSHTSSVINSANCPILVVPPKAALVQLRKVVFATDFEPQDVAAVRYLDSIRNFFDLQIEIVHVTLNSEKERDIAEKERVFNAQLANLKSPAVTFKEIKGKDVVGRLNHITKQTGADLLAMTHGHYSWFEQLFTESMAKKELGHQKNPLLIFPANWLDNKQLREPHLGETIRSLQNIIF